MKKFLKIAGGTLAVVVLLAGIGAALVPTLAERKMNRVVAVDAAPVAYVGDAESLARGKYLFETRGCSECHGANGAGRVMVEAPDGSMRIRSPNISPAGVVAKYNERDWVRAIRHGVKPDGRPVFVMPSEDYNRLSDADLASLVAYTRSLAPAQGGGMELTLPFVVKALYAAGALKDASEKIDHKLPPEKAVAQQPTAEHGKYIANTCIGCHGAQLSGGKIPGAPPGWPAAANLTPGEGSAMKPYDSPDKFKAMMRTGKRPDGSAVSTVMPFESLARMNDVELDAMYAYFRSLPPRAFGGR